MTIVSGGKVFERCPRCRKLVQMNGVFGGYHVCVTDCGLLGRHVGVREEIRGVLWWRRTWLVCDGCGRECPKEGSGQ